MRVCVVGCGAIGSIYAAHLARQPNIDVWAFDTDQTHVDAMIRNGLRLEGVNKFVVNINATTDPTTIPPCDFVIIATKSDQTKNAIETAARFVRDGTVCSFQNGMGNEDIIAAYVSGVVSGTLMVGGHICAPGVVEFDSNGPTWIGCDTGSVAKARMQTLADALTDNGLETIVVDDPRTAKWTKLIFNAAANPLCALTRLPFGELYRDTTLRALMHDLVDEGVSVAYALGITLERNPHELLQRASKSASTHLPSMMLDVLNERPTEIDSINGYILRHGREVGLECRQNERVIALVKGLESSWQ